MNHHLLVIDPQNDFCDIPVPFRPIPVEGAEPPQSALPVPGAHADMLRLSEFIAQSQRAIQGITVTLDSHHRFDIGHPVFWERGDGSAVPPFTQVTLADVRSGILRPRQPELRPRVLRYLEALENAGTYRHMVWPVHCELGTWGHNVHFAVQRAYAHWEDQAAASVGKVLKGKNPYTEQYSAIRAEVPDPEDPETADNLGLLAVLERADRIYIAGEASSHCVKATTEHLVAYLPASERKRLVILEDCMSPVEGFEVLECTFFEAMRQNGVSIMTSAEALKQLREEGTP
jgi:nicotinamidase-related amidase